MCGIIGIMSNRPVAGRLIQALERLEYRGYDSAGIAMLNGAIHKRRAAGKLVNLKKVYDNDPADGHSGIGHTRWASHGPPTLRNAHPHGTENIAVVHNGIIENFPSLKEQLPDIDWQSDTDTEIVVHLFEQLLQEIGDPMLVMPRLLPMLEGAFALVILLREYNNLMLVARRGSPMALAAGDQETMVGSDAMALSGLAEKIYYMNDGEWAALSRDEVLLFNTENTPKIPEWQAMPKGVENLGKGNYPHAMLREIHEQPSVVGDTLNSLINPQDFSINWYDAPKELYLKAPMLQFSACGTAYYATQIAGYWFEQLCHLPVRHDIASEMRYRGICALPDTLGIFVSQSGETMDLMEAMRVWQQKGFPTTGIVNVPESSIARAVDHTIYTLAGPEISVASTKAFTTQLTALFCLALWMAQVRKKMTTDEVRLMVYDLLELPAKLLEAVHLGQYHQTAKETLVNAEGVFFLGRGALYPLALEGALKFKEITYKHAEGYAAGEMKHGPIALVSEELPSVFIAPSDSLLVKTLSNVKEITARGGRVILLTDQKGLEAAYQYGLHDYISPIVLPSLPELLQPILYAIPVQMLAYETAAILGREIDQPRNLAKSVTVE